MAEITRGTGNVFANLGFPDAEGHALKTGFVQRIAKLSPRRA